MAVDSFKVSRFLPVFLLLLVGSLPAAAKLEFLNEEEVKAAIKDESYIVVLFSEGVECTGLCAALEDTLESVREDVVEAVNAWVIRTHSPTLAAQYGLVGKSKASGIVFLRNGIPLLYTGPADDDEFMLNYLVTNPESAVRPLNDDNFEHDTQAASGATTGDWLAVFVRAGCEECDHMRATVEAVAAILKSSKSVALIDRDVDGGQTTRRFAVKTFPAYILFRQGRMYRYTLPVVDASSLAAFAKDGFRNARAEHIPLPITAFDDYTEFCADWLRENPNALYGGAGILVLLVVVAIALSCRTTSPPPKKESKKKK